MNLIRNHESGRTTLSRRNFLRASATAGGLTAVSALGPAGVVGTALRGAAQGGDVGVLQFALSLEHLENALYRQLEEEQLLEGRAREFSRAFYEHDQIHARTLSDAIRELGAEPVRQQERYNFPELRSQDDALDLLATVEDVGVSAYLGAASVIGDPALLTTAVTIHNVEAYHTAGVQAVAGKRSIGRATGRSLTQRQTGKLIGGYLYGGTPSTGGGVTAEQSDDGARFAAIAGLGAAALAGAGLARERGAAE